MDKGTPEYVVDQGGLYYPAAPNYYGYYCTGPTGYESSSEWDDHQRFFGLGGTDPHYAGMLIENLPYVYYTPSCDYTQSPYNPYNPYVPGAIVGVDGSFIGEQQYYAGPAYEHCTPSPAYYPYALQSIDSIPNSALEPHLLNTSASGAIQPGMPGLKHPSSALMGKTNAPSKPSTGNVKSKLANNAYRQAHSLPKTSDATVTKQPLPYTSITSNGAHLTPSLVGQNKTVSGPTHATNQFLPSPLCAPFEVSIPIGNGTSSFKVTGAKPRLQHEKNLYNGKASSNYQHEQNRGPRINKDKSQWRSSISVKAYRSGVASHNVEDNITIHTNHYNKEDFPANYTDAKFFVIKSYSEDDVHKSIKYNVWSSTSNGNRRLDSAYEDAKQIASGKPRGCPIFLFFSVNASGQFCGVAEMIGPVDFHKDMGCWQHDKWNGSFPVKWHIVKDVLNSNFRRIILENNEYRPVTNSRDTQEICYKQGMEMLHIFKTYSMKTSIFDDFIHYEDREKIMMEHKAMFLSRKFNRSFYLPTSVPTEKSTVSVDHSCSADENAVNPNGSDSPTNMVASTNQPASSKHEDDLSSTELHSVVEDADGVTPVLKIESPAVDPKLPEEAKSSSSTVAVVGTQEAVDKITEGSLPIKVNGLTDAVSGSLNVGTIPIHLEGFKPNKSSRLGDDGSLL